MDLFVFVIRYVLNKLMCISTLVNEVIFNKIVISLKKNPKIIQSKFPRKLARWMWVSLPPFMPSYLTSHQQQFYKHQNTNTNLPQLSKSSRLTFSETFTLLQTYITLCWNLISYPQPMVPSFVPLSKNEDHPGGQSLFNSPEPLCLTHTHKKKTQNK